MRRGFTLIELMIAVALIGVTSAAVGSYSVYSERAAQTEVQRERARILVEYYARCMATGLSPKRQVVRRLVEALPDVKVEQRLAGDVATIKATWTAPQGSKGQTELTVFAGAKR